MEQRHDIAEQITGNCLLGRTRFLSRVLTSIYDEEVRGFGLQASQVTLLAAIAAHGPLRRSEVGRALHFDSSTLTRNLRVMLGNGWLEEVDGTDGRGRPLQITPAGSERLQALAPAWHRAQGRAACLLGGAGRTALLDLFDRVAADVAA